jgi:hypothetical protein
VTGAVWFGLSAWKLASPNRGIVAVILLMVGSILAVVVALLRARPFAVAATDVGVAYDDLHRLEKSLRVIRLGRGVVSLVCSGLMLFWIMEGMAMARTLEFLVPSSIIAAVTACLYLPWLRAGERRLGEQHAAILQRLKDLKGRLL